MTGESEEARFVAEVANRITRVSQYDPREDVAQPVRYLWPTLSSLWQAPPPADGRLDSDLTKLT